MQRAQLDTSKCTPVTAETFKKWYRYQNMRPTSVGTIIINDAAKHVIAAIKAIAIVKLGGEVSKNAIGNMWLFGLPVWTSVAGSGADRILCSLVSPIGRIQLYT